MWQKLRALPPAVRIGGAVVVGIVAFSAINIVYQVAHKPTEMLFPLDGVFTKTPDVTWREYGPLFREYSTATITPELLAALAQVESAGNPVARTYWRWRLTLHPFAIYEPASSSVGLYQMTDAAFAEAQRYCIRDHVVIAEGCWLNTLYIRIVPSHAIELTAVFLDRAVAAILARSPHRIATMQEKQDLAAFIHLCGAGQAEAFARRGFHVAPGEHCGDHDAGAYVAKVEALRRRFLRLAAEMPAT